MAVLQAVPAAADTSDPDTPTAQRLAAVLPADETQLLYSIVLHGRAELGLAPDEYSGLVMVLLRMLAFKPSGAAAQSVIAGTGSAPATPRATVAAATVAPNRAVAKAPVQPAPAAALPAPPPAVPSAPVLAAEPEPPPWVDAPWEDDTVTAPAPLPASTPARTAAATPPIAPAAAPLVLTPLGDRWARVVRHMADTGSIGALVRELAMQAQCVAIDEQHEPALWTLRVEREMLRSSANGDKLLAALADALKRPVRLRLEAGVAEDSPARRDAAERERKQATAEQIIHNDPLVQALLAQYKSARIVPGSVKPH
jgi:DNA polymerase-3 subunit gamma/tau